MPTHNQIDLVEFSVHSAGELSATTTFLSAVFGWSYRSYGDDYSDSVDSGVTNGVNASEPGERARMPLAVVYVDDLAAARTAVVAAGGSIVQEIFAFPGGRRFHFTEPSGNELAIWSDK